MFSDKNDMIILIDRWHISKAQSKIKLMQEWIMLIQEGMTSMKASLEKIIGDHFHQFLANKIHLIGLKGEIDH